jgi:hypothetical protein
MLIERLFRIRTDFDHLKALHKLPCHFVVSIISQDTQIESFLAATTATRVLASPFALSQQSDEGWQAQPAIVLQMTIQFTAKQTEVVRLKSVSRLCQRITGDGNQFFSTLFGANACARIAMTRLMHDAFVSTKAEMQPCQGTGVYGPRRETGADAQWSRHNNGCDRLNHFRSSAAVLKHFGWDRSVILVGYHLSKQHKRIRGLSTPNQRSDFDNLIKTHQNSRFVNRLWFTCVEICNLTSLISIPLFSARISHLERIVF